jgi:hypothetical protein
MKAMPKNSDPFQFFNEQVPPRPFSRLSRAWVIVISLAASKCVKSNESAEAC